MGKKSKKLHKTEDQQLTNVEKSELRDGIKLDELKKQKCDLKIEINDSTVSITKLKKKNRKRDAEALIENTSGQIKSEVNETNLTNAPANFVSTESTETKKKKKKKSKLLEENTQEMELEITTEVEDHKPCKDSKKKNNKSMLLNGHNLVEETPQTQNEQVKQKKKSKSKAKTGAPVLNDEESQVTEEDIDRFCDELGEEDNKQYEDWVKLLDARLSKKQPQNK